VAAEPALRDLANQLMDEFIENGQCDLLSDFGTLLPAIHIVRALGFEDSLVLDLVAWVHTMATTFGTDPEKAMTAALSIYAEINKQIEQLKASGLREDLISALMGGEVDGAPLSEDDIASYVFVLIGGGLDTTGSALGNALIRIQRDPDLRGKLLQRPDLVPNAIEEFLRIDAPIQGLARTMAEDVELCGQQLQAGDKVLLLWGSANRDPQAFDSPDEICLEREQNRHLSFGVGLHRCLGSHIGRTMFRVMLETVLARIPDFELLGDPKEHRFPGSVVFGVEHLPSRFSPGQRVVPEPASVP
jgi:cytochrome P450